MPFCFQLVYFKGSDTYAENLDYYDILQRVQLDEGKEVHHQTPVFE